MVLGTPNNKYFVILKYKLVKYKILNLKQISKFDFKTYLPISNNQFIQFNKCTSITIFI